MSPRFFVRTATVDVDGTVLNSYPHQYPIGDAQPKVPWAIYLTDDDGRFRFLCFDLDSTPTTDPRDDCDLITGLLDQLAIEYVVCKSGPSGSRHVWIALADPAPAQLVYDLGILMTSYAPSCDRSPLSNPATGSVRPPLAPHRQGGFSTVIKGDLEALLRPSAREGDLRALCSALSQKTEQKVVAEPVTNARILTGMDHDGHPYLVGQKRSLPQFATAALETPLTNQTDASTALWRVLIGAAAARWKQADVQELVAAHPGMEHVRTLRVESSTRRRRRPQQGSQSPESVLARQWRYAVRHVATSGHQSRGSDPTFDRRAHDVAMLVDHVQTRADASLGRWEARPSERRVLDALCLLIVSAVRVHIEADIRRLALMCGIGRETVRVALHRLADDRWIQLQKQSSGVNGSIWSIDVQNVMHRKTPQDWSQAVTRPEGVGAAWRLVISRTLTARLSLSAHDVFTRRGLGIKAGNTYALLHERSLTSQAITTQENTGQHGLRRRLERLRDYGLVQLSGEGLWSPAPHDLREYLAKHFDTSGVLDARQQAYQGERDMWAWWIAESMWMKQPATTKRWSRGPVFGQHAFDGSVAPLSRLPRNADGRIVWSEARRIQRAAAITVKSA